MPISRWNGSSFAPVALVQRWTGSAWQACGFVRRWNGSAWIDVIPLTVSATPTNPEGNFMNSPASMTPSTRVITSGACTATASGGAGGYTYAWARISGSAAITAASPTAATTTFSATVNVASALTAVFRVTATDAALNTATFDVTVQLTYESGF